MLIRRATPGRSNRQGWVKLSLSMTPAQHRQVGLDLRHCWGAYPGDRHMGFQ